MSNLYYGWDNGANMILRDHSVFQNTAQHHLYRSGEMILKVYGEVLHQLWHEHTNPAALRLQSALAAAVEDVSASEYRDLSSSELADLRLRCGANKLFTKQTAPPLVVFFGKLPPTFMESTGSEASPEKSDREPWMVEWDAQEGPWLRDWGCHIRGTDARSWHMYLSATYVVWPYRWQSQQGVEGFKQATRLHTHLKITLFNELVHHSRLAVWLLFPSVVDIFSCYTKDLWTSPGKNYPTPLQ